MMGNSAVSALVSVVIGAFLFGLSFYEEQQIGGVKLGVLWKGLVLGWLIFYISSRRKIYLNSIFWVGVILFFKMLFYVYGSFSRWLVDFSEALKFLVLPLAIAYFCNTGNEKFVVGLTKFLCYWIPISCIPFFLGVKPDVNLEHYDLDIYGLADASAFFGIFSNPHVAAVTLAAHLLLTFHAYRIKIIKILPTIFLSLASASALYMTYARTGWFSYIIGMLVYVYVAWPKKLFLKRIFILVPIILFVGSIAFASSDIFRMRLTGTNLYVEEVDSNQLGSGRFLFWSTALLGPLNEGVSGFLIGVGLEQSKDNMEAAIGWRIFSHNGFLDAYQNSGIIGFCLFVSFWLIILNWLIERKKYDGFLALGLFAQLLMIQLVQGGSFWWFYLIFASSFYWIARNERLQKRV